MRILQRTDGLPSKQKYLVSTYFDTPGQMLRQNGVSLEVRQAGKKRLQAIRAVEGGIASHHGGWNAARRRRAGFAHRARHSAAAAGFPKAAARPPACSQPMSTAPSSRFSAQQPGRSGAGRRTCQAGEDHAARRSRTRAAQGRRCRRFGRRGWWPNWCRPGSPSKAAPSTVTNCSPTAARCPRPQNRAREAPPTRAFQTIASLCCGTLPPQPAVAAAMPKAFTRCARRRRLRAAISIFSGMLRQADRAGQARSAILAAKLAPARTDVFLRQFPAPRRGRAPPRPVTTSRRTHLPPHSRPKRRCLATAPIDFWFQHAEWIEGGDWRRKSRHGERPVRFAARLISAARRSQALEHGGSIRPASRLP